MKAGRLNTLKIAILGTRGIPNRYGGFEECAARLSVNMAAQGHHVTVYNPDTHPYRGTTWKGVHIRRIFSHEDKLKAGGNFIYDYLSLRDAVKNQSDIVLALGYSPSSFFYRIVNRKNSKIITNMDGLEWKRPKWGFLARRILKYGEKRAVLQSDALISDNPGIREFLKAEYGTESSFIPYGAEVFSTPDFTVIEHLGLKKDKFLLVIARIEPENNIDMIIRGVLKSDGDQPLIIVGPLTTGYSEHLKNKYQGLKKIKFIGGIYDKAILDNLRFFCAFYFHGHSVGGTNPSLLEAMAAGCRIAVHDNVFNRSVVGADSCYFTSSGDIERVLRDKLNDRGKSRARNNRGKILSLYNWGTITERYLDVFEMVLNKPRQD